MSIIVPGEEEVLCGVDPNSWCLAICALHIHLCENIHTTCPWAEYVIIVSPKEKLAPIATGGLASLLGGKQRRWSPVADARYERDTELL